MTTMVSFFGSVLISAETETVTQNGTWPSLHCTARHSIRPLIAGKREWGGEVRCWLGFRQQEKSGIILVGFYVARVDQNRGMLYWRREPSRRSSAGIK